MEENELAKNIKCMDELPKTTMKWRMRSGELDGWEYV